MDLVVLLILMLPFIYLYFAYPVLPERVPIHWGIDGKPNDWTDKDQSWMVLLGTSLIALINYCIFRFIPVIDPKKKAALSSPIFNKTGIVTVIFIAFINTMILFSASTGLLEIGKITLPLVSLLIVFIGNLMYNLKPNYFLGIRTPWTLENEENWKLTHRLSSKLWVGADCFHSY